RREAPAARRDLLDLCRDRGVAAHGRGGRPMTTSRPQAAPPPSEPARPAGGLPAPGPRHGPFGGKAGPPQKPLAFGRTARRLLSRLRPERGPLLVAIAFTVVSITLNVIGPRVIGHATDLIFTGAMGRRLPAGLSKDEPLDGLRASGEGQVADMLTG